MSLTTSSVSVLLDMLQKVVGRDISRGGPALLFAGGAALSLGFGKFLRNASSSSGAGEGSPRKKAAIYTKTGDKGSSSLYNGERRKKTDQVFHALGEQDELCAAIGVAREYCNISENGLSPHLIEIQSRLFDLGAAVATPTTTRTTEEKIAYTALSPEFTMQLEEWIDELDAQLPPLTTFIIPSGGFSSTHLHLARVVCRRAERAVIPLVESEVVDLEVGRYLNRLSDYLFTAARTAAHREDQVEIEWRKASSRKK
jgi:cob(I)alamin adenosyltransferase